MNKKTALDLACENIDCGSCPLMTRTDKGYMCCPVRPIEEWSPGIREKCKTELKQYFKQQADISDGWDVVRKIEEFISDDARSWHEGKAKPGTAIKTPAQNQINALSRVSNFIYSEVKKRGMEEEIYE